MDSQTEAVCVVYDAYRRNIEKLGGHYGKNMFIDTKHWSATAKLAERHKADPGRFVNAQFAMADPDARTTITPRSLHTPAAKAVAAYLMTAADPIDYPKVMAWLETRVVNQSAQMNRPVVEVLEDPDQAFPPWFRIVYAPFLTENLSAWYLEEAKNEYSSDLNLREFLKKEGKNGRLNSGT